jgi:glycosyltransferase involved in cell wall biosynthesis
MSGSRPLRIGYLNQDFPPEVGAGPARVLELARHWQAAGAHVTVITGMPSRRLPGRADGAVHPSYRGRYFTEEDWDGLRVLRSWVYVSRERGPVRTVANNASFMFTSALFALVRAGRLDVIVASSPPFPAHLSGETVRLLRRVPLVLEIRDLWPDYLVQMGMLERRWARRALFGLERYLLRRARRTVVVTRSFRTRVAGKGIPRDRIDVVPNGVNVNRYYPESDPRPPLRALARLEGEFIVGYLGNFGAGQGLHTVLEAASLLRGRAPDVRFVLAGDGRLKRLVQARAAELRLANLSIHAAIDRACTRAFYNSCDLCLVPLAPVPIFSETVPSKLFEILACGRPLVGSVAGEAAAIIKSSGGGWVSPPGDAAAMAEAILRARRVPPDARIAMGRRGRAYVARNFNRETLARRYLSILEQAAGCARLVDATCPQHQP